MNLSKTCFCILLLFSLSVFAKKCHFSPLDKKLHTEIKRKLKNFYADFNYSKIEKYIQEGANVNSIINNYEQETPLHYAVQLGGYQTYSIII